MGSLVVMKCKVPNGFTLIELVVILSIVAILVAVAVPAYRDYTIWVKVGECINKATAPEASIAEYRQNSGSWPASLEEAGFSLAAGDKEYCSGFTYNGNGDLTVNLDLSAIDSKLSGNLQAVLRPGITSAGTSVDWRCTKGNTDITNNRYLPPACRDVN